MYFEVVVVDRQTKMEVTVGSLLAKSEAMKLYRSLEAFNTCNVFVKEFHWYSKKGKIIQ